ncbi:MAG TPA: flagellar biosynthesis protein FliQ [Phycisphaerae bacterium]|nr:flagellar biosynthesis protein FliQ [Phycisphaerae bacterium]
MDAYEAIDLARRAVTLVLIVGAPVLATALVVGLVVSVLQAVTQVQEQTLSFVPKILAVLVAVAFTGAWMLDRLVEFGREMFGQLP